MTIENRIVEVKADWSSILSAVKPVDIDVRSSSGGYKARVKGDKRKLRSVGSGKTWQEAVADLGRIEAKAKRKK